MTNNSCSSKIKEMLATLTSSPGVYQMFNAENKIIYVGKAINLKKRVSSYFQKNPDSEKLASLVKHIDHIKVIVTENENEALLLENQLIKQFLPRYNILMRDDKSYPYIVISKQAIPRVTFQRGVKHGNTSVKVNKNFTVYGPYPNTIAVRETVKLLQKIFKLRTCRDSFFKHRTRPCLLYQIKLCSAPCVGHITTDDYLDEVKWAKLLLEGKNQEVIKNIVIKMKESSENLDYETAAKLRDQITYLRHIQTKQVAITTKNTQYDVFSVIQQENIIAVELLIVREGGIIDNHTYYPEVLLHQSIPEILSAFLSQYYFDKKNDFPKEVLLSNNCHDKAQIEQCFGIKISVPKMGKKNKLINLAIKTAKESIKSKFNNNQNESKLAELKSFLSIDNLKAISRIACVDISHHAGESAVASCVIWNSEGFEKNYYRKINIKNITPGDDYAAMSQALEKYFQSERCIEPDILLIDGGRGQLNCAHAVLEKLGITHIYLLSIAKGFQRKSGLEKIYFYHDTLHQIQIDPHSPAFYLLQRIRDEAHRFAISSHRQKQSKKRRTSILDNIPGIGPKKRQALLHYLGGLHELKKASIEQFNQVPGINQSLVKKIFKFFHPDWEGS
jgi:excinuclease ABC subunit C